MSQNISRVSNINTKNTNVKAQGEDLSFSYVASAVAEHVQERILEGKRERARARANAPVIVRSKGHKKPFPVSFVFYSVVLSLVFCFLIYNYSIINSMSYENESIQDEIELLSQENEQLSILLDKRNDLNYIEEYAINELGMVKSTDVVKQYVSLSGSDNVVVTQENMEKAYLGTTLNSLKRSVQKIFD